MEQPARRWLIWFSIGIVLLMSAMGSAFAAYWYVLWPIPPHIVVGTSRWLEPQFRAHVKILVNAEPGDPYLSIASAHIDQSIRLRGSAIHREYLGCLESSDVSVRWAALWFIESVIAAAPLTQEIQAEVISATEYPDPAISDSAMRAIAFLTPEVAKPVLRRALASTENRIRAIEGLAIAGDREAAAWLMPLLSDSDPKIRGMAVRSLTTIGDPGTVQTVQQLSTDEDRFVALSVQNFLEKMASHLDAKDEK